MGMHALVGRFPTGVQRYRWTRGSFYLHWGIASKGNVQITDLGKDLTMKPSFFVSRAKNDSVLCCKVMIFNDGVCAAYTGEVNGSGKKW